MKKILVTAGLPYANGPIHLGHLLEYITTDIFVRFQKLLKNEVYYFCGSDCHGTPIMLSAQKEGKTPEELITETRQKHLTTLQNFLVNFDNFYTTHSPENKDLTCFIYEKLKANHDFITKEIMQFYDEEKNIFLPDRFLKGTCPKCGAHDQYGDNCEVCGATYSSNELIDPISVISGTKPIKKTSEHLFFNLPKYQTFLEDYLANNNHVSKRVANKLKEWFHDLKAWDISRDGPYFGFEIPDKPGKYFYVWLDAPIGYMASTKNYFVTQNKTEKFAQFWDESAANDTELYHFIGKDIMYFHALFWPAILKGADFRRPSKIFVHGYLKINGQKFSKSRGNFITGDRYLKNLDPEYLRYYFASRLNGTFEDVDFNLLDFKNKINSDLVGKLVNLASRSAKFINSLCNDELSTDVDQNLIDEFLASKNEIINYYENVEYSSIIKTVMALTEKANQYIDEKKPWVLAKEIKANADPQKLALIQRSTSTALNLFRILVTYLKPILPNLAQKMETFFQIPAQDFSTLSTNLSGKISKFTPLMKRIEESDILLFD